MSDENRGPSPGPKPLPEAPDMEWLRGEAMRRAEELRAVDPKALLSDAQFELAREYGFASWRELKAQVEALSVDGRLFESARAGEVETLKMLLDQRPEKLQARQKPYEWTLLHTAAHNGHPLVVELLLSRGLDPNLRERGDNTYAIHWAAAAGHLPIVRRLADAGADVIGRGDDHEMEVIGWASAADDPPHRAVVDFLVRRGARHHIFSAISL